MRAACQSVTGVTPFVGVCKTLTRVTRPDTQPKFSKGRRETFSKGFPTSQRAQNRLAGRIFDGIAVKSAFALLLASVTEPKLLKSNQNNTINQV